MADRIDIGDIVASSMQEIIKSDNHKRYFGKQAAKCCSCKGKCDKECACKGKCMADCSDCMSANDSNQADDEHQHDDKCACGDAMTKMNAINEMIDLLSKVSAVQENLGLQKSSSVTLQALETLVDELKKNSQDVNDVKVKDVMMPGSFDKDIFTPGKTLEEELDEIDPIEALKATDSPASYRALIENPAVGKASLEIMNDPDDLEELARRVNELGWNESTPTIELAPTEMAPPSLDYISGEGYSDSEIPSASELGQWKLPSARVAPNLENEFVEEKAKKGLNFGRDQVDSPDDFKPSVAELKALRYPSYDPNDSIKTVAPGKKVTAFDQLDTWLKKQSHGLEHEDLDFEEEPDEEMHAGHFKDQDLEELLEDEELHHEFPHDEELDMPNLFDHEPELDLEDLSHADDMWALDQMMADSDLTEEIESGDFLESPEKIELSEDSALEWPDNENSTSKIEWNNKNNPHGISFREEHEPLGVRVGPGEWKDEMNMPYEDLLDRLHNVYLNPTRRKLVDLDQIPTDLLDEYGDEMSPESKMESEFEPEPNSSTYDW